MQKTNIYKVILKDGGGKASSHIVPAPSESAAEAYFQGEFMSATSEYIGEEVVSPSYNTKGIAFSTINREFDRDSKGYAYLLELLKTETEQFIEMLKDTYQRK
jgi:glutamate dehydrogenase/leucine dehydrogenase